MTRALQPMLSTAAHSPALINRELADSVAFPGTAAITLGFYEAGFLRLDTSTGNEVLATQWANETVGNAGIAGLYEIRLTAASGLAPTSGDLVGTWLSMVGGAGGARKWGASRTALGDNQETWLIEIRSAATGQTLASASYNLTLTVSAP